MPKWRWECRECFSLREKSQGLTWKQAESLEKWVPKATYKQLGPGVASMRGSRPAVPRHQQLRNRWEWAWLSHAAAGLGKEARLQRKECFLPRVHLKSNFSLEIPVVVPTQLDGSFALTVGREGSSEGWRDGWAAQPWWGCHASHLA